MTEEVEIAREVRIDTAENIAALASALDHARGIANFAADIRTRNFNFFIVIIGALVIGHEYLKHSWTPVFLAASGLVVSVFFFGLDLRMRAILKARINQLEIIEPEMWRRAGLSGWKEIPRSGPIRFTSHLWIYRGLFVLSGLVSLGMLVQAAL